MPEVLEFEQIEETETINRKWDSWTVEIPQAIVEAQGLNEGSLATFTIKDDKVKGEIITPSPKLKEISKRILEKRREVFEDLKRLGD